VLTVDRIESPIGPLTVVERDDRLCLLHFGKTTGLRAIVSRWYPEEKPLSEGTSATRTVLRRYFDGDLRVLDSVQVELNGTPFQQRVWNALRAIPAGSTLSYSELARRVGAQAAVRAVGAANGANPVALVVPCHRVIGANGTLVGYGGGLPRKRWLLAHEGVTTPSLF
jgi:methylated-DNA-[protein]-cysteine S-methyltransferase